MNNALPILFLYFVRNYYTNEDYLFFGGRGEFGGTARGIMVAWQNMKRIMSGRSRNLTLH
jgi:hypothetical protein